MKKREELLTAISRDNTQILFNAIWQLPAQVCITHSLTHTQVHVSVFMYVFYVCVVDNWYVWLHVWCMCVCGWKQTHSHGYIHIQAHIYIPTYNHIHITIYIYTYTTFVAKICFSNSFFVESALLPSLDADARAIFRCRFRSFLLMRSFLAWAAFSNWSSYGSVVWGRHL